MAGDVEPSAGEVNPQRNLHGGLDAPHQAHGGDRLELRRRLGQGDIGGAGLVAERLFEFGVLVVLGDGEDVGAQAAEVVLEVQSHAGSATDHDVVHHPQGAQEGLFVLVREGGAAALVVPQYLARGERNRQVAAEGARIGEEPDVAGVQNIVAAGDEDLGGGRRLGAHAGVIGG